MWYFGFFVTQDINLHWTLVDVVMNIRVPHKTHNFLTNWDTVGFLRNSPLQKFRLVWVWNLVCHIQGQSQTVEDVRASSERNGECFSLRQCMWREFFLIISYLSTSPPITTLQLHSDSHISFVCSRLPFPGTNSPISTVPTAKRLVLRQLIVIWSSYKPTHPPTNPLLFS